MRLVSCEQLHRAVRTCAEQGQTAPPRPLLWSSRALGAQAPTCLCVTGAWRPLSAAFSMRYGELSWEGVSSMPGGPATSFWAVDRAAAPLDPLARRVADPPAERRSGSRSELRGFGALKAPVGWAFGAERLARFRQRAPERGGDGLAIAETIALAVRVGDPARSATPPREGRST
jgi:hypothetical protein